ncbi:hypothetical protein PInf_030814 [Phytophthora infestans]|nr:hypothetical protein PInf_030814 [Phytophthora infestans]
MAYRPQANGSAERMVQTITRALKMYVQDWIKGIGMSTQNGSLRDEHRPRQDPGYRISPVPVVHVSKLKLVKEYPDRPQVRLSVDASDRVDFDEVLLPEDSWNVDLEADEFEVEKITDMRSGKRTRYGRIYREFLVHWRGYDEPSWVDEADLNCGALLYDFLRDRADPAQIQVYAERVDPAQIQVYTERVDLAQIQVYAERVDPAQIQVYAERTLDLASWVLAQVPAKLDAPRLGFVDLSQGFQ